jgi:demethylmenaquinone methyltransferase/2-methoxy-6-polyprenyl-1,4-benzoquinol methylase
LNQHRLDFFGKSAPYYDTILDLLTFKQYAGFQKRAMEVLAPQSGEKILDLCSGTGRVASWIAQAVGEEGEVVGMDISKSMVEVAKRRYGGIKRVIFLHKDVTKPWEYQNYFDGIFTSFALHELPEKKRLGALEHSFQALKKRGRMVIVDFNPQVSGRGKTILLAFFKLFERDNLNFFSFNENELLKKAGFNRIRTFPVLASMFQITLAQRISD